MNGISLPVDDPHEGFYYAQKEPYEVLRRTQK